MIYILLPVYNEEKDLPPLLERVARGLERKKLDYLVVAYNDGCVDNSVAILEDYKQRMPIEIIGESTNKGLGVGFKSLIKFAAENAENEDDIAIVLDADNTHNPEHLFQMVDKIHNGFDLVIASRYLRDSRIVGLTWFRKFLSTGASWLMRTLFPIQGVRDYTCGYRAYRIDLLRRAIDEYGDDIVTENGFACMAEFLIKLGKIGVLAVEVPLILRYDNKEGESKMDIKKTIKNTLNLLYKLYVS